MSRPIPLTSAAFEALVQQLPSDVDAVLTADGERKYLEVDGLTYVARLDPGAALAERDMAAMRAKAGLA